MSLFLSVLSPMMSLFLLILTGVYMWKKQFLDDIATNRISVVLLRVCNPILLLASAFNAKSVTHDSMLKVLVIATVVFFVFGVLGIVFAPAFDKDKGQQAMFKLMMMFSNLGFMGIPVVSAVLGTDYLVYVSEFMLVYNLIFYTYGMAVMEGGFSRESLKKILNIGTVTAAASFFIVWFGWTVPDFLLSTLNHLGNCNTPLALMLVGAAVAKSDLKSLFSSPKMYVFCVSKLIVLPLIAAFALKALGMDYGVVATSMIMVGMPVGNMPLILGTERGIDCSTCSAGIVMTTLLCVMTVPLLMTILG